jgi:hypothetical protein
MVEEKAKGKRKKRKSKVLRNVLIVLACIGACMADIRDGWQDEPL